MLIIKLSIISTSQLVVLAVYLSTNNSSSLLECTFLTQIEKIKSFTVPIKIDVAKILMFVCNQLNISTMQ